MYNRKFNCFVRPTYDGSHQSFPGLDLKALEKKYGIEEVYQSQKDCVWMLKQNGVTARHTRMRRFFMRRKRTFHPRTG